MLDIEHTLRETFDQGLFTVTQLRRPLTLCTLEPVDESAERTMDPRRPFDAGGHQFWFDSEYLHHLLSMATDPSVDNTVEVGIIDARLALSSPVAVVQPARTVRVRTAVLADGLYIEAAVGRVGEQPDWIPRGARPSGATGVKPAVQHVVRRRDIEPCLLARSLHWIELRPTLGRGQGTRPGP
ncbi:MAG: hypothetical protein K2W80_15350 [Burkholderiales bacterium]|nr:hypothetical protein [Burkholderiales bacterium]